MGFSLTGALISASLLLPNLLMLVFPPVDMPANLKSAGLVFTVLERGGQAACMALPCMLPAQFDGLHFDAWLVMMLVSIAGYYALWARYVFGGRRFVLLFDRFVPMAILPVAAFGFAAIAAQSLPLGIAVVVLAVGHITNSVATYYGARPHP